MASVKEVKAARSRNESCGSLEQVWKRKREKQGEEESEEEEIFRSRFRSSKKTVRLLDVEKGLGGG